MSGKARENSAELALWVASFLFCILSGNSWSATPDKLRLQLKWFHQFQFAGYYTAAAKGFYREEGLDVEIIEGSREQPPVRMVTENKAEFGVHDGGDLVFQRIQGAPLVALAVVFQHSPYVIISRKSSALRHPADLVGQTVPITQDQGSAQILAMFRHEGIRVKSVFDKTPINFVQHGWDLTPFIEDKVKAISAYSTEMPRFRRLYGFEPAVMNPLDYGVDFYGDTLFTSETFLRSNPDVVERFRRASLRGWEYAMANQAEIASLIAAMPSGRDPKPGYQDLLDEAQAMNGIILPKLIEIGHMNPGRWEKMAQVYQELGMAEVPGHLEGFSYSPDAEKQAIRRQLRLAGFIMLFVIALYIASLVWIRILRSQVKTRTQELEDHRLHLEDLVEHRTRELATTKAAAEAASHAKSVFLANMSHELRTPMNAIMGLTGIAMRRTNDPRLRDQLGKIDKASQHLLKVINDILDISKIEAERLTLEQRDFKLQEVLASLCNLIGQQAEDKGLKLAIDLPAELARLPLRGDPLRFAQVLLNYTANAVKFTERGSVSVHIRMLEESPDSVLLRCAVSDTGIGISAKDQQRLFSAFEQADGSMTRKYGGTGLGLAISKRLTGLMGGETSVDSQPGQGSTFWFTARLGKTPPTAKAGQPAVADNAQPAETRLKAQYAGSRIMLAEDEPIAQEVSRALLEDAGLVVELAEDGRQAVELAGRSRYDLILMDMQMPNLNGVDATMAIRGDSLNRDTPILAMTANAFDEDRAACLAAGMNDHIGKPVDPDRLYGALLWWLELRSH